MTNLSFNIALPSVAITLCSYRIATAKQMAAITMKLGKAEMDQPDKL